MMKSKRSTVVTALAIAGAAVVGILLASMLSNGDNNPGNQATGETTTSTTAQQAGGEASTSSTKKASGPPATYTAAPTPQDQERTIREYYDLLASDLEASWGRLSQSMQAAKGGFEGYKTWWSQYQSVELTGLKENSSFAYEVDVTFTTKSGGKVVERKLIVLQWTEQSLFISNEQNLA